MVQGLPTWFIALAVVRRVVDGEDEFLLVQERKHGRGWFLPAGRVDHGEDFFAGARREAREEAGIPIELTGVLRVEHRPALDHARMRVFFLAKAADDTPPKSEPDEHSMRAAWFRLADFETLPLRGIEVYQVCRYVAEGGAVFPLDVLVPEGAPWE